MVLTSARSEQKPGDFLALCIARLTEDILLL
jgi:hypothetical protein